MIERCASSIKFNDYTVKHRLLLSLYLSVFSFDVYDIASDLFSIRISMKIKTLIGDIKSNEVNLYL